MDRLIKTQSYPRLLATLVLPALVALTGPLNMTLAQSLVLATLILTVTWWATGYVNREAASVFLLIVFMIFGNTPVQKVFAFPLSPDFIIVIASFLLSQGMVNAKVADRLSKMIIHRFCDSAVKLVIMSFVLGIVFIFIIPQPFPRVIILASIYSAFLKHQTVSDEEKKVLLFSIFVASTTTCMVFLNGDVILNYAAINFSGAAVSQMDWIRYMSVPGIIVSLLLMLLFLMVFRKDLKGTFVQEIQEDEAMGTHERLSIVIMTLVVVLWMSESFHGLSSAYIASAGVVAMYVTGILGRKDLQTVNYKLLIFLTAAFAIGRVMAGSGVAKVLSDYIISYFPAEGSLMYLPFILMVIVVIHMLFGSTITALSVVIPSLVTMTEGTLSPAFIALFAYVAVSIQYLLPFHHVTVMIGFGNGYYDNRHTLKFGLYMTVALAVFMFLIFVPWWRLTGLL